MVVTCVLRHVAPPYSGGTGEDSARFPEGLWRIAGKRGPRALAPRRMSTPTTNEPATIPPVTILVDADACPVKEEIYRVAARHKAHVRVVSNSPFRVPVSERVKRVVVSDGFDAADDWIAQEAGPRSVVITADIPLADRCLKAGATVLRHDGRAFDAASIGAALATRAIMEDLRAGMDGIGGGPPPFSRADRSNFLQTLDRVLVGMGQN